MNSISDDVARLDLMAQKAAVEVSIASRSTVPYDASDCACLLRLFVENTIQCLPPF